MQKCHRSISWILPDSRDTPLRMRQFRRFIGCIQLMLSLVSSLAWDFVNPSRFIIIQDKPSLQNESLLKTWLPDLSLTPRYVKVFIEQVDFGLFTDITIPSPDGEDAESLSDLTQMSLSLDKINKLNYTLDRLFKALSALSLNVGSKTTIEISGGSLDGENWTFEILWWEPRDGQYLKVSRVEIYRVASDGTVSYKNNNR